MKKIILRIILGFVLVMILAVVAVLLLIDPIAKSGVEKGASYALGVETTVDSVDVRLLDGQVIMDDLNIANPEGFTSDHLVHTGQLDVQVDPGSFFSEAVQVRKFELDGLEMHIEQKLGSSNVSQIMDNIKRLSKDEDKEKQTSEAPSKKVKVERILIKNVVAHFHMLVGPALKVEVPTIELKDVSSDGAGGVAGQLASQIFSAVLEAVLKSAKGIVPADFLEGLDKEFLELGGQALEQAKEAAEEVGKVLEETGLEEPIKDAGKSVGEGLDKLGESIFGSKKDSSE
jgi:hypothetical protein